MVDGPDFLQNYEGWKVEEEGWKVKEEGWKVEEEGWKVEEEYNLMNLD